MNLSVSSRWQEFLDEAVRSGRYAFASEVVQEGLRLVEVREKKLSALRERFDAAVAEQDRYNDEDVEAAVNETLDEWDRNRASVR